MRAKSAVFAACVFALGGLIIPSHFEAEAAGPIKLATGAKLSNSSSDSCTAGSGELGKSDCKDDSKDAKKIDLDRKGHKVKKSKSRGR